MANLYTRGELFPNQLPKKFYLWRYLNDLPFYSVVSKGGKVIHAVSRNLEEIEKVSSVLLVPHVIIDRKKNIISVRNYADLKQRLRTLEG